MKQITSERKDGMQGIAWTPQNRIVYSADHLDNWDLFIVDADGKNERQLTFDKLYHGNPTVCDEGRSVVYQADAGGTSHLWRVDLQGGASTQLTNGLGESLPACAGAGHEVFYLGQTEAKAAHPFKAGLQAVRRRRSAVALLPQGPYRRPTNATLSFRVLRKTGRLS